ncbi:MAG: redox-sensing transcriptional repressor Rex [Armatimonadota bacterium]
MEDGLKIPISTLERLTVYLRYMYELRSIGVETVSSAQIEQATGIHAAQFRKDLSYFGEFGRPGVGYEVGKLQLQISSILKVDNEQPVLLVGAGHLGSALVGYTALRHRNFNIVAVFDNNYKKIGRQLWDLEIHDIVDVQAINETLAARLAIMAVPAYAAQGVADQLVAAGIKAILNFAPTTIRVPDGVFVRDVCFISELAVLSFYLSPDVSASSLGPIAEDLLTASTN